MVIVLVCTVAATIAVIAVQLGMFRVTSEVRMTSIESAQSTVDVIRNRVRASLQQDPTGMYSYVLEDELPRTCIPTDTIVNPGSIWPAECGTTWTYASAIVGSTSGATLEPPGPGNANLRVNAFARSGTVVVGTTDTYQVGKDIRPRLYTGESLNVTDLGALELNGPVYSYDNLIFGTATVSTGGVAAAENQLLGSLDVVGIGGTFAEAAYEEGPPTVYSIRGVYPQPMPPSLLRSSITALSSLACPGIDPFATDTVTSSLCLEPGGRIRQSLDTGGGLAVIPATTESILLLPGVTADLAVYASDTALSTTEGADCSAGCDLNALPSGNTSAGSPGFWTLVGETNLPGSAVVSSSVEVMVGLCGAAYATGGACASRGDVGATQYERNFTLIAGTLNDPVNAYIGGPITADGARIGIVASGSLVVPYFAVPAGSNLTVQAQIAILAEDGTSTALRSLPEQTTTAASARGRLTLDSILLLAEPSVDTPVFAQRTISLPQDVSDTAPWFPTPALTWERSASVSMTPDAADAAFDGT